MTESRDLEIRREIRRRYERGRCSLCQREEDAEHAFLKGKLKRRICMQ
jgi:hypothetical protein